MKGLFLFTLGVGLALLGSVAWTDITTTPSYVVRSHMCSNCTAPQMYYDVVGAWSGQTYHVCLSDKAECETWAKEANRLD